MRLICKQNSKRKRNVNDNKLVNVALVRRTDEEMSEIGTLNLNIPLPIEAIRRVYEKFYSEQELQEDTDVTLLEASNASDTSDVGLVFHNRPSHIMRRCDIN